MYLSSPTVLSVSEFHVVSSLYIISVQETASGYKLIIGCFLVITIPLQLIKKTLIYLLRTHNLFWSIFGCYECSHTQRLDRYWVTMIGLILECTFATCESFFSFVVGQNRKSIGYITLPKCIKPFAHVFPIKKRFFKEPNFYMTQ